MSGKLISDWMLYISFKIFYVFSSEYECKSMYGKKCPLKINGQAYIFFYITNFCNELR